jgi:hypothetical protein
LASSISASSDRRGTLAHALELLLAELVGVDQPAAEALEKLLHPGHTSESMVG